FGTVYNLADNNIRSIYEDHTGRLWIGTNNGLTSMTPSGSGYRFELYRHDAANPRSISDNIVTAVIEDTRQHLWLGTQNGGINEYDPSANSFTRFTHSTGSNSGIINNYVRKIVMGRDGKLWLGTQEGLSILDPVTKQFSSYQFNAADKQSLSQNSIHSMYKDANGSIWIGTYFGGVNVAWSSSTSFTTWQNNESHSGISNNVVSGLLEDEKHNLWVCTEGGGLNYFNRATGVFTAYKNKIDDPASIGSNLVKLVFKDKDGNLWIGTHGGGLNLFNPARQNFTRFMYKENDVETLGTEITALLEDDRQQLWVGTQTGLKMFRRNGTSLSPLPNAPPAVLSDKSIKALFTDSKHRVWVGTPGGLYLVQNNQVIYLPTGYINTFAEDAQGHIWVGLYYGGLSLYDDATQSFTTWTEKEGLPNNNVMGILEDGSKNLWISTDAGLARFDPTHKKFQLFTLSDGLAGNGFNYNSFLKDSRGQMFFGGFNGLTAFFPDSIQTNSYLPPVVFTGLKLFNNPVEINGPDKLLQQDINFTKNIVFNYNQNVFTIDYALLNYIKSAKNRYAYKLEGFDKDWNEITATSVTYTNLRPGHYTFLVKGANNDGVWGQPASLQLQVLPPFWLTWWAWCIYTLLAAAILFFMLRFFFLRALLKREDELHQVKLNFFTNISHEIRTHLTLIMAPVENVLAAKEQDSFTRQQLTLVKSNANRLLKLVNELMDFRKAETGNVKLHLQKHDLVALLQEIYDSFRHLSLEKRIT
ncbi:MAG TPA: two-component regulator propeller domain-containing protein, partial [Chitinophagaceae bacterium]|nr:two-component regulator propeller domain-containing protein [Chitinophagaceae bacterium]